MDYRFGIIVIIIKYKVGSLWDGNHVRFAETCATQLLNGLLDMQIQTDYLTN